MASRFNSVNVLVCDNSRDDFLTASRILIKFASNIINYPNELKYRKIRLSNPTVQSKLLNTSGGMECLFEMGFEEDEDFLTLKTGTSLQGLSQIMADLEKEREKLESTQTTVNASTDPSKMLAGMCATTATTSRPTANKPASDTTQPSRSALSYMATEAEFFNRLQGSMSRVMEYENPRSQEEARKVIPVEDLTTRAKENFELNNEQRPGSKKPYDMQDYLLLALLRWFKTSFFKWVDTLPCSFCSGPTHNTGSLSPSNEDLLYGAGRVEAHTCNVCTRVTRFPRYGNAVKLLETRRGRCGEWADCFTLCCRALNFEARYVLDWTDHVWTEVFSVSQDIWLHCDPCENVMDKPLLYESGWGKKLTYVIAFAKDDIRDVTWRYSSKHIEILSRRKLCREKWLIRTIDNMRIKKISDLPEARKKDLELRLVKELVGFLHVKEGTAEALPGRTTGSREWRTARGELGNPVEPCTEMNKSFVFKPSEEERESEMIHICYSCAMDTYIRKSSKNENMRSWLKCTFNCKNVQRKEEYDWKMTYLARQEGTQSAEVSWKFDLDGSDLRISKMELKASSAVFEGASISWRICAGENCFVQSDVSLHNFMTFDLHGSLNLSITAVMKGGKGENAWQQSQLFRQPMDEHDVFPFEIKLFLD